MQSRATLIQQRKLRFIDAIIPMTLCLRLFVTSRCSIEMAERIELIFGTETSCDPFYIIFHENSGTSKI